MNELFKEAADFATGRHGLKVIRRVADDQNGNRRWVVVCPKCSGNFIEHEYRVRMHYAQDCGNCYQVPSKRPPLRVTAADWEGEPIAA